ncbi:hypothetical protein [Streptomyces sp.]|uniref:hypothetical protein n=1 Tax=Streptomyces sp. TaxID=1931 RepID=UPI002F957179
MNPKPEPTDRAEVNPLTDAVMRAAVDNVIHELRRDSTTPPAQKPERPAMSSKATDDSVRMLCFGGMALLTCGGISLVMVTSEFADPKAIGVFFAGLAAVALAAARLLRRAGEAAPTEIHQTYTGPIRQETNVDQRKAVVQKNITKT